MTILMGKMDERCRHMVTLVVIVVLIGNDGDGCRTSYGVGGER